MFSIDDEIKDGHYVSYRLDFLLFTVDVIRYWNYEINTCINFLFPFWNL
jgi:hypothetical protein